VKGSVRPADCVLVPDDGWLATGAAAVWPAVVVVVSVGWLLAAGDDATLLDGALLAGDVVAGLLVVVVWLWLASGSTYCWLPADWASAAAGAKSASAAQSASTLRQLSIV
jgi:hypothetical protein